MKKYFVIGAVLTIAFAVLASVTPPADARPQYQKAFLKQYPKLTAAAKKAKCNVCHRKKKAGEKGKPRNDYGTALQKSLPKKNCKIAAKIIEALTKTEKAPIKKGTKKPTYGDRIKDGKLPASPPKK